MSIQDEIELNSLKAVGRIVRQVLDAMKAEVRPGVTTRYLDEVGGRVMQENGAHSAPSMVYKFPGVNCISLNDEAVHGVPGERELKEGDIVKLDVTLEKDGYMADAAITVPGADHQQRLGTRLYGQGRLDRTDRRSCPFGPFRAHAGRYLRHTPSTHGRLDPALTRERLHDKVQWRRHFPSSWFCAPRLFQT